MSIRSPYSALLLSAAVLTALTGCASEAQSDLGDNQTTVGSEALGTVIRYAPSAPGTGGTRTTQVLLGKAGIYDLTDAAKEEADTDGDRILSADEVNLWMFYYGTEGCAEGPLPAPVPKFFSNQRDFFPFYDRDIPTSDPIVIQANLTPASIPPAARKVLESVGIKELTRTGYFDAETSVDYALANHLAPSNRVAEQHAYYGSLAHELSVREVKSYVKAIGGRTRLSGFCRRPGSEAQPCLTDCNAVTSGG